MYTIIYILPSQENHTYSFLYANYDKYISYSLTQYIGHYTHYATLHVILIIQSESCTYWLTRVEPLAPKHQWIHQWWNPHLNPHNHPGTFQRTGDDSWRLHQIQGFSERTYLTWSCGTHSLHKERWPLHAPYIHYTVIFWLSGPGNSTVFFLHN